MKCKCTYWCTKKLTARNIQLNEPRRPTQIVLVETKCRLYNQKLKGCNRSCDGPLLGCNACERFVSGNPLWQCQLDILLTTMPIDCVHYYPTSTTTRLALLLVLPYSCCTMYIAHLIQQQPIFANLMVHRPDPVQRQWNPTMSQFQMNTIHYVVVKFVVLCSKWLPWDNMHTLFMQMASINECTLIIICCCLRLESVCVVAKNHVAREERELADWFQVCFALNTPCRY